MNVNRINPASQPARWSKIWQFTEPAVPDGHFPHVHCPSGAALPLAQCCLINQAFLPAEKKKRNSAHIIHTPAAMFRGLMVTQFQRPAKAQAGKQRGLW